MAIIGPRPVLLIFRQYIYFLFVIFTVIQYLCLFLDIVLSFFDYINSDN